MSAVTKPCGKEIAVPVPRRPVVRAGSRDVAGAASATLRGSPFVPYAARAIRTTHSRSGLLEASRNRGETPVMARGGIARLTEAPDAVLLTDLLTRQRGTGETQRGRGSIDWSRALVSETNRARGR